MTIDIFKLTKAMWCVEEVPHSVAVVILCMIYKGKGKTRDDLKNYRPIGLETTVLKMLEGYLTLRLKHIIDDAVPVTQTAYQSGMSTMNNVIWVRCTIQVLLAVGLRAILGLLDASGAFDSLSWRLIDVALKNRGADATDLAQL
eukprot:COSAG02_NODE_7223_length_3110_cov_23.307539_3_plen_144_part_00